MKNTIVVCLGYSYIAVTPEILGTLLTCPAYEREYRDGKHVYTPVKDTPFNSIEVVSLERLQPTLEQVELNEILEENNRLTRLNERLREELASASASKAVSNALATV